MKKQQEIFQTLLNKKYDKKFLERAVEKESDDSEFLSLEDFLLLEQLVGKEVKLKIVYANGTVDKVINLVAVQPYAMNVGFVFKGGFIPSVVKKSIKQFETTGSFLIDRSNYTVPVNGISKHKSTLK